MALTLQVGTAYTYTEQQLWAALGEPGTWSTLSWEITPAASTLPPGMTATGAQVTGTPTAAGTFNIRMTQTTTDEWGDPGPKVPHDLAVTVIDPNAPEPEIPAEPADPLVHAVARFLGHPDNPQILALAAEHVRVVTTFVWAYTRGHGFDAQEQPNKALADVIVSCTARHLVNPSQHQREALGAQTVTYANINGFTLPEQAVLHLYRKRAA